MEDGHEFTNARAALTSRATMNASQALAAHCADLSWARLDPQVRRRTAELLLDFVGVAAGGTAVESSGPIARLLDNCQHPGQSTVFGRPGGFLPEMAALANGTAAHALELDDVTRESSLHPAVTVIPAALAVSESRSVTPVRLAEAIVAGYEVTIRVGNALGAESTYRRGFHPTGVAGAFGAAAAAGVALGLNADALTRALGIAGTMAAGSLEYLSDGSWTKRLNAGWAAHAGVLAASLAEAGFTGPSSAIDGRLGALTAYTDHPRPARLLDGLGETPAIMSVAIKPYACCRYNHGLIDGILALREAIGPDINAIQRIRLGVLSGGALLVAEPIEEKRRPLTVVDAQFSAPFAAAVAIVFGRAGAGEFTDATLADARLRSLMARTDCVTSVELDRVYPSRWPATVMVEMRDGRTLERHVDYALGEPENPIPIENLIAKFTAIARPLGLDEADAERILSFDEASSVAQVVERLRRQRQVLPITPRSCGQR